MAYSRTYYNPNGHLVLPHLSFVMLVYIFNIKNFVALRITNVHGVPQLPVLCGSQHIRFSFRVSELTFRPPLTTSAGMCGFRNPSISCIPLVESLDGAFSGSLRGLLCGAASPLLGSGEWGSWGGGGPYFQLQSLNSYFCSISIVFLVHYHRLRLSFFEVFYL